MIYYKWTNPTSTIELIRARSTYTRSTYHLDFIFVHGRLIDLRFTTRNKMIRHSNETGVITRSLASSNLEIHDIISLTETRPIQLSLTRTLFATGTSEIMDLVQRFRQIVARPRATALRLAPFVPLSFHPFPRPLVLPKPEVVTHCE